MAEAAPRACRQRANRDAPLAAAALPRMLSNGDADAQRQSLLHGRMIVESHHRSPNIRYRPSAC